MGVTKFEEIAERLSKRFAEKPVGLVGQVAINRGEMEGGSISPQEIEVGRDAKVSRGVQKKIFNNNNNNIDDSTTLLENTTPSLIPPQKSLLTLQTNEVESQPYNDKKDKISPFCDEQTKRSSFYDEKAPEILFEDSCKKIRPSLGVLEGNYYFGQIIPCMVNVIKTINKKQISTRVKRNETILIQSEYEKTIIKSQVKDIECSDLVPMPEQRWELTHIKSYIGGDMYDIDKEKVFDRIKKKYLDYIDFNDSIDYDLLTLWDIGTYFFVLFHSYPYMHLHGFKGCGKTKVMQVSSCISFNGLLMGGIPKNATFFRIIEANSPTLYLDEFELADKNKQDKDEIDLQLVLNAGYKEGGMVYRNELINNKWTPTPFNVYCPKMIANISGLNPTLSSRSIKIVITRAKKNDKRANKEVNFQDSKFKDIRNDLYVLALEKWMDVQSIYNNLKCIDGISNRDWELWKPILSIAKFISESKYKEMVDYALNKIKFRDMENSTGDSWEEFLLDILSTKVEDDKYYGLKDELCVWLWNKYFIECENSWYDKDGQFHIKTEYKKERPQSKWISNTLRKIPGLKFRVVNGLAEVNLSKQIVSEIICRLKSENRIEEVDIIKEEK